jgi:hypothetical protein
MPSKDGIQSFQYLLDHGFRRGDSKGQIFKALAARLLIVPELPRWQFRDALP